MLPPPYKFRPASPEIVQPIQAMEEVESIGSFEDEVASAREEGEAMPDDPDSTDLLEENSAAMQAERTCSIDMDTETEISSGLPVVIHTDFGSEGDQAYPGFKIWRDDSV